MNFSLLVQLVLGAGAFLSVWPAVSNTQSALVSSGADAAYSKNFSWQARDQVLMNDSLFTDAGRVADAADTVRQNALVALLDDPLNAMALRQLSYTLSGANNPVTVPLLKLADRTSRRDLLTQITLIEFEVESGDAKRALRHYNRTLSAYPEMAETLFPILAKAANEPDVKQGLRAYLGRPWFRSFLAVAVKLGTRPETVVEFWSSTADTLRSESENELRSQLLDQLLAMGAIDEARKVLSAANPSDGQLLGDPSFSIRTMDTTFGPFAWRLSAGEPVTATQIGEGWVEAEISSGRSGLIATRVTLLPSGRFSRTLHVKNSAPQTSGRLMVKVRCLVSESVLLSEDIPSLSGANEIAFLVPEGCGAQEWRISASSDFGASEARFQLKLSQSYLRSSF